MATQANSQIPEDSDGLSEPLSDSRPVEETTNPPVTPAAPLDPLIEEFGPPFYMSKKEASTATKSPLLPSSPKIINSASTPPPMTSSATTLPPARG